MHSDNNNVISIDGQNVDLRNRALAALLAWLISGAGHFYQRRYAKGSLFFVCILSTWILGFVLGGGHGLPLPRNAGDWIALSSGMVWALGSLGLYRAGRVPVPGQVFAFLVGALVIGALAVVLEIQLGQGIPAQQVFRSSVPYVALSAVFVIPMLFLTVWPATLLSPARVRLLLMSEVVVGLFSAALLANEAFGWREFIGAVLIVSAAVIELMPQSSKA